MSSNEEAFEEYKAGLKQLDKSGITEAYECKNIIYDKFEDVLRKLCSDGFPTNNYFDLCAYYLLEFETIVKERDIKDTPLKELVAESLEKKKTAKEPKVSKKGNKNENPNDGYNKLKTSFINEPMEKNMKIANAKVIIPKEKIKLKSKELAVTNFNIEIDNQKFFSKKNREDLLPERIDLNSVKFVDGRTERTLMNIKGERNDKGSEKEIDYSDKDKTLKNLESTNPEPVSFVQVPMESFEIEVDMVNHLTSSGALEKFDFKVHDKPPNLMNNKIKEEPRKSVNIANNESPSEGTIEHQKENSHESAVDIKVANPDVKDEIRENDQFVDEGNEFKVNETENPQKVDNVNDSVNLKGKENSGLQSGENLDHSQSADKNNNTHQSNKAVNLETTPKSRKSTKKEKNDK